MKRAWVLIRDKPHYRSESFVRGLQRTGYSAILISQLTSKMIKSADEILVCWNAYGRYGMARDLADKFRMRTFVVENGYYGKDKYDRQYYAIAEHGHTGSGRWRVGGQSRFLSLLMQHQDTVEPWRKNGKHILICGQRGIGEQKMRSPYGWEDTVKKIIQKTTDRPIVIRPHPGRHGEKRPLVDDLKDAWACVVWSSNCATTALLKGIPTFYDAPHIVHQGGALPFKNANLSDPDFGDRDTGFRNMAWAQWSVKEIENGTPWKFLLPVDLSGMPWTGGFRQ